MINKELYDKLIEASKLIELKSRRGGSDYIVVNPEIAKELESEEIKKKRDKKIDQILK